MREIMRLFGKRLRAFRNRHGGVDADEWDAQIERDMADGKLDDLAETALSDHGDGRSERL